MELLSLTWFNCSRAVAQVRARAWRLVCILSRSLSEFGSTTLWVQMCWRRWMQSDSTRCACALCIGWWRVAATHCLASPYPPNRAPSQAGRFGVLVSPRTAMRATWRAPMRRADTAPTGAAWFVLEFWTRYTKTLCFVYRVSCILIHTQSQKLNTRYIHNNFRSAIWHCCTTKFYQLFS